MKQRSPFIKLALILILALFANINLNAAIRYVTVSGAGTKDGTSWANAYAGTAGITTALGQSASGDEVLIAGGQYTLTSTITVPVGVKLVGGYNSTTGLREMLAISEIGNKGTVYPWEFSTKTILRSNGFTSGYVVNVLGTLAPFAPFGTLDGVTVQSGTRGGVLLGDNSVIKNCSVINNRNPAGEIRAAGIYYATRTVTIESCLVANNELHGNFTGGYAADSAGGIGGGYTTTSTGVPDSNTGGVATINNSMILCNKAINGPGGISFGRRGLSKVTNCVIAHNQTEAKQTTDNTAVSGGVSGYGNANTYGELINCTVAYNKITVDPLSNQTGGVASIKMTNCVVYGNAAGSLNLVSNAKNLNAPTNSSTDNTNPFFLKPNTTAGAITLTAALAADYSILAKSPLINMGNSSAITASKDLAGNDRSWNPAGTSGGVVDIGAYEYQGAAERFVVYTGVADVLINTALPSISVATVATDTRVPSSTWSFKYFSDSACTLEVITPSSTSAITYYVKAFDSTGRWVAANTDFFEVSSAIYSLTVNGVLLRNYVAGATVVGTVAPASGKFVEELNYTPNSLPTSPGGVYNFTMPSANVIITSNEKSITPIRYVHETGLGDKKGYSWQNASAGAAGLQSAINDSTVTEVRMASGTYTATSFLPISRVLIISGGYNPATNMQDFSKKSKVIDNSPSANGLFTLTAGLTLSGFEFSNSISAQELFYINAKLDLNISNIDVKVYNAGNGALFNAMTTSSTGANANINVSNSTFSDVTGGWSIIHHEPNSLTRSTLVFRDCRFEKLKTTGPNRLIFLRQSSLTLINCIFNDITSSGSTNIKSITGTLTSPTSNTTITNNTIAKCPNMNFADIINTGSTMNISNTYIDREMSGGTKNYCAWPWTTAPSPINNNINLTGVAIGDIFTNSTGNDFTLVAKSPLINAGLNTNVATKDFAGNARIAISNADVNSKVDIGAYEYHSFTPILAPTIGNGGSFKINFTPPVFAGANAWMYEVTVQGGSNFVGTTATLAVAGGTEFITNSFENILNDGSYSLRVAAVNRISGRDIIISDWSPTATVVVTGAQDVVVNHENGIFSWSVSSGDGVAYYEVIDQNGNVIATKDAGLLNYQIEAEGDLRLVIVNVSGSSQTFYPDSNNVATFSLNIETGWNLIAVPFENADLKNLNSAVGHTYWSWNGEHYEIMQSEIVPLEGFWVYSTKNQEITISGKRMASTEKALNVGWNLCGPTNNIAVPNVEAVFGWDVKNESNVEVEKMLLQGYGYWLFTIKETVIKL